MRCAPAFRRVLLVCCAAVLAVGCSGSPAPGGAAPKPAGDQPSSAAPAAAGQPAAAQPAAARPRQSLRASYGATVAVHVPLIAAQRLGEWESEGVDVDVQRIATSTSITALIAGDLDVVQVSAPALVSADLQGGADLVFIAGALDRMIIALYTMPDIRSGADLRGKPLGTDRPGTPIAFAMDLAIARLGLTIGDVQLLPVGSDGMVPGMETRQLVGGAMSLPMSTQVERQGAHLLVPLYDVPYQNIGLIMKRADLDRLGPALPGFLKVYRRGIERFSQDPTWAKETLSILLGTTDEELIQDSYDFHTKSVAFTPRLRMSREGLQGVLDSLRDVVPAASSANPDQFYDHRFVDQLDRAR